MTKLGAGLVSITLCVIDFDEVLSMSHFLAPVLLQGSKSNPLVTQAFLTYYTKMSKTDVKIDLWTPG